MKADATPVLKPAVKPAVRAAADGLRAFTTTLFERAGMSAADAAIVAKVLVWADLRGVGTHGVSRVPRYLEFIASGEMNPSPVMTVTLDAPAVQVLDANRAAGPVAMLHACERAVALARAAGIGLVMVKQTTHTAALGCYTQALAEQGMIGIALSASGPLMAVHGARAAGVSTAPISIATPGPDQQPVLFDMATGVVSMGKLAQAKRSNEALAEGWALDAQGQPTTDPQAAKIPLPLGGPKGSGLALMIELLASLATANPILSRAFGGGPEGRRHQQNAWVIAVDVFRFAPEAAFRADVSRTVAAIKALPAASAAGEILLPGERGTRVAAQRERDGIPLGPAVTADLTRLASLHNVTLPWVV